jgi:hypothetical protein
MDLPLIKAMEKQVPGFHSKSKASEEKVCESCAKCPECSKIFSQIQEGFVKHINGIQELINSYKFLHYIKPDSTIGCFKISSFDCNLRETRRNFERSGVSMTTNGIFLYLLIGNSGKGMMFKIGTGERNTMQGKVYIRSSMPKDCYSPYTWTYCKDKLYLRGDSSVCFLFWFSCNFIFLERYFACFLSKYAHPNWEGHTQETESHAE